MKEDEKVSHLMKGVAEDIYQALLTREINDTASFIKWCSYIEDMKQKRVGRPRFEGFQTSAPVQKFPPEPRKTDVWRTADNRSVCFHCGRPGHVMRYCRERKAVFDNSPKPPTELRRHPRRHIADPVSRQAVGARKTKESDLQGEAACTGNPPSTAKMTGNQLDVIIDKKPIRALVDSGASFSVISDKYRRFLKKVLFADAKERYAEKVADGNFVRPIGKCVLRVRINNRELPFEFIVFYICSHDVILGWDFLERLKPL
ncbi:transposon Ty3-I Gag-Pol polyprotein [Trichonephila clavipes]|nr:transposon Ty3-I Gag-Pol polyprotein [Trichonephila clavipes]